MHTHSFLHPDYVYKDNQHFNFQAPDIFIIPPEEDKTPPWCCYNSQHGFLEEDSDSDSLRYAQSSRYTPYFHRSMPGTEALILPSRKASTETRSIVDALGDADDYSDHEIDQEPMDIDLPEYGGDDEIDYEMGLGYGRHHQHRGYRHREQHPEPPSPTQDVGNDSDVIEIVKVRRREVCSANTDVDFFGPFESTNEPGMKSSLRSRATKAFRSLRGAVRPSSKISSTTKESNKSLSRSTTKSRLTSKSRVKTQSRSRAQDIFAPIENIPQMERENTTGLSRRPSSRLAQMFSPMLRQGPSGASVTASFPDSSAPYPHNQVQDAHPTPPPLIHHSINGCTTRSRRSSSSTQTRRDSNPETRDIPTPTRNSYQRRSEDDEPMRSSTTHEIPLRSISPTLAPRSTSPFPSNLRPTKRFSVLNLHKIFHKSTAPSNPSDDSHMGQVPSTSSTHSTCPSLSSTPTSEWSGRTTPTVDSVPQTPTYLDENETRRTIVPIPSCSTVGSGISLGSSLNSGAVSSLSSSGTVATCGSISSAPKCHPDRAYASTLGKGDRNQKDDAFFNGIGRMMHSQEPSRPSAASIPSTISTRTASSGNFSTHGGAEPTPFVAPPMPEIGMSMKVELDLNLGLGINLSPSQSGGMASSNGLGDSSAATGSSNSTKSRGGASIPRSLSLKNIGSRFGIGKQQAPPVPPLPISASAEEADMSMEMKLNSLHFDDLSFDADKFVAH